MTPSPRRPLRAWAFLAAAIATEVTGSLSLRGALDHPWLYAVVVASFVTAISMLSQVLRCGIGLGVAYGIWGACGVALTAAMSAAVYDEPLTGLMGAGVVVIIAGVLCIELGAQAARRRVVDPT